MEIATGERIYIAISGAGGVLGRALLRRLFPVEQLRVVALTRDPERLEAIIGPRPGYRYVRSDETSSSELGAVDVFIHGAYPRADTGSVFSAGVRFVHGMMSGIARNGVKSAILISSQAVYGSRRSQAAREGDDVVLEDPYSTGKYMTELSFAESFRSVPHSIVRLGSLVSECLPERALNRMIDQALHEGKLAVFGGVQSVDLLDAMDAADALGCMVMTSPSFWKPIYNLGSGRAYTWPQIALAIRRACRLRLGRDVLLDARTTSSVFSSALNSESFFDDFSWSPRYSLDAIIERLLEMRIRADSESKEGA
jgi:nucleoside-diphosphate-sugar epimerase